MFEACHCPAEWSGQMTLQFIVTGRRTMKSPIVASLALVAVIAMPAAAIAATKHHHKMHHAAHHHSARAAYGLYDPPTMVTAPIDVCNEANLNTVTVEACDKLTVNGL